MNYYTYTVNKKQSQAQLMGYFEDFDTTKLSNNVGSSNLLFYGATTGTYANRRIGLVGKNICILLESNSLAPVQATSTGSLDVANTATGYTVFCDSNIVSNGTGAILKPTFVDNSVVFDVPTG